MRFPRILFYAINGLGLGHVTRLLAIARRVRARSPEAEIVFLTSSEAESVIFREGFAAFKVPSKTLRAQAHIRPATYARMVQTVALNLLASFHPHVLVVDTFPGGAMQELLPVLRWDSRKVFVFRAQRPEAARSPVVQGPLNLYDLAVIPHHEGEEDAPLPDGLDAVWTGPIMVREAHEAHARGEARGILALPVDGPVVYVTFGGGGDGEMDQSLGAAVEALSGSGMAHVAVPAAPLYRGALARRAGVTVADRYPMADCFAAFDCAISAAGYNSAMELLHHGVPTAFMPFPRQVDDQETRAERIAAAGAGLRLTNLETPTICAAVKRLLDPVFAAEMVTAARRMAPGGGAERAADAILRLIP